MAPRPERPQQLAHQGPSARSMYQHQNSRRSPRPQVQPQRQQSSRRQRPTPAQHFLPKLARHRIHRAVSAPQADSQEQVQEQQQTPEAVEASAQHPEPEQATRSQPPAAIEGPAASDVDSFSSDPSSARFCKH